MSWIPYLIALFVTAALQQGLAPLWTFGGVRPDLLVVLAMLASLRAKSGARAALACWVAGLMVDLTTATGPAGPTVVGPMSIGYVLAGALVFRVRELFFSEHTLAQAFLAGVFCVIAHSVWIVAQMMLGPMSAGVGDFTRAMGRMLSISLATAGVAFILSIPLRHAGGLIGLPAPRAARRRGRRV